MFKRAMGLAMGLMMLLFTGIARGEEYPVDVSGIRAAVLIEQTCGEAVISYNAGEKLDVGGLARLPALLAVCEKIDAGALSVTDKTTVSEAAARVPGPTVFIEAGECAEVSMLLKAGCMICAGDAIYALGEAAFGSHEACAAEANRLLKELGIEADYGDINGSKLRFSAEDLGKLGARLVKSGAFRMYSGMYYEKVQHEDGRATELASSNRLLKTCPGTNGVGTGSSAEGGYCGVFSVKRGDSGFICAVIGAKNSAQRGENAKSMVEYGFAAYDCKRLADKGEVIAERVPVKSGTAGAVSLTAREDAVALALKNAELIETSDIPELLEAPLSRDRVVGSITYTANGKTVGVVELVPGEDVPRAAVRDYICLALRNWLHT